MKHLKRVQRAERAARALAPRGGHRCHHVFAGRLCPDRCSPVYSWENALDGLRFSEELAEARYGPADFTQDWWQGGRDETHDATSEA